MASNRIKISVRGDARDAWHVRLTDFLRQLDSVRKALRETEGLLHFGPRGSVYYRILSARHASPLTVELEAVSERAPEVPARVVEKFLRSIRQIKLQGEIPADFNYLTAEAYRGIVLPQHEHVSSLVIGNGRESVVIDRTFEEKLTSAIGPDEYAEGSVMGTLDTVKLHNITAFEVFPTIGPRKVSCYFPRELKEEVKRGLERYVHVYGRLRYKHWDKFPYAIDASGLDIYPPDEELPKLGDFRGMAPGLTGGLEAHEFLEQIRDAWET